MIEMPRQQDFAPSQPVLVAEVAAPAEPSPLSAGVRSCCPRCGQGRLFDGFLKLAPRCNVCRLDYSFADPADGPAFFVMMVMAWPVTAFGIWIELAYDPPLWVHVVTTLPFLLLACTLPLRFFKGWLVASQYYNKAEEARFEAPTARPELRRPKAGGPSEVSPKGDPEDGRP